MPRLAPRRSRRAIHGAAIAVALMAIGVSVAPMAQAATPPPKCVPKLSTTIKSTSLARVFAKSGRVYVCLRSNGRITRLTGGVVGQSRFALGGRFVTWSSSDGDDFTVVNVINIADRSIVDDFPFHTNDHIDAVVVKSTGAAAWVATPSDPDSVTYLQGTDRRNHEPDTLSDDQLDVVPSSLRSLAGHAISWSYSDDTTGTTNLY